MSMNVYKRKSQVMIFIIIAVTLVLLSSILICTEINGLPNNPQNNGLNIGLFNVEETKFYIKNCVENEFNSELHKVLENSGIYLDNYEESIILNDTANNKTVYYYTLDTIGNVSFIEKQIEYFVYDIFFSCRAKYSIEETSVNKKILLEDILINLEETNSNAIISLNILATQEDIELKEEYEIIMPIKYKIYDLIKTTIEIASEHNTNNYTIQLQEIINIAEKYDFKIKLYNDKKNTIIYQLYEEQPYYEFNFALNYRSYDCTNIPLYDEMIARAAIEICLK